MKKSGIKGASRTRRSPGKSGTKRVFIVEDHPVFREGLLQMLERDKTLELCGSAGNATSGLRGIRRAKPDIVIVDLSLPGKSGLDLIREVRAEDRNVKLLVVSMHDEAMYANRVLRAGGDGYIMKQKDPEEILEAIQDVLDGHIYISEEVLGSNAEQEECMSSKTAWNGFSGLTDDELMILEVLGAGKMVEEIAEELHLTVANVNKACSSLRKKLRLKTANALVRYAVCWVEQGKT